MVRPKGKVYFVGAGPGDPELLTLKGKRIIELADLVLYADSLVSPDVCGFARPGAQVVGSKTLTLDEIGGLMVRAARAGETVARIHSGDPAIYGAILEQMRLLEKEGIEYEVIPGVSSAFAAAALLKTELTVPGESQTVIITRMAGRTGMPARENLKSLAAHGSTLVIFLSITRINKIVQELRVAGYSDDTHVAVVYRVGWPDEKLIRGTLKDITAKVRQAKITLQALVLVGKAVDPSLRQPFSEEPVSASHLYAADYTHLHRRARVERKVSRGQQE